MNNIDLHIIEVLLRRKLCCILLQPNSDTWNRINEIVDNRDDLLLKTSGDYAFILLKEREEEWLEIKDDYI